MQTWGSSFVAYLLDSYPQKAETPTIWQKILNNIMLLKKKKVLTGMSQTEIMSCLGETHSPCSQNTGQVAVSCDMHVCQMSRPRLHSLTLWQAGKTQDLYFKSYFPWNHEKAHNSFFFPVLKRCLYLTSLLHPFTPGWAEPRITQFSEDEEAGVVEHCGTAASEGEAWRSHTHTHTNNRKEQEARNWENECCKTDRLTDGRQRERNVPHAGDRADKEDSEKNLGRKSRKNKVFQMGDISTVILVMGGAHPSIAQF